MIPPLSVDDARLQDFLGAYGWRDAGVARKGGS